MVAEFNQEAADYRVHDQLGLGLDMLWSCSIISSHASDQSKEILLVILPGQRLHLVQLLLLVGSLQPPGAPAEQRETAFHLHLSLLPHSHPLLRHGPPVRHPYSNRSMCSSNRQIKTHLQIRA